MLKHEQLAINTIRLLAADEVQTANSGHPGLPLGAAPMAVTLFSRAMKQNPKNLTWQDRDRFVLSAGHGSSLLYALYHVFGFGLEMDELKRFRQHGALTPGHPEYKHTPGVEVTTGPLGQGIANAVGMAWAEKHLAAHFNRPNFPIVDHYTYAITGDGCLQEGITGEACSLAGTLGLGKLILLYDSNNITIEGDTNLAFTEDVLKRYESYHWHVQRVEDGNDTEAIAAAIEAAKKDPRPSFIEIKTKIGFGAPNKQGKAAAHGEPLGAEELRLTKQAFGFDPDASFHVPDEVRADVNELLAQQAEQEAAWHKMMARYQIEYPELYDKLLKWHLKEAPIDFFNWKELFDFNGDVASRMSSHDCLNRVAGVVENLVGGSADLAPSTKGFMAKREYYSPENPTGSNIHFGIREHAMAAMANGIALHGGLIPFVSGFFVFSDYMKPSMRLSALMDLPVIYILTHDSIGVGEDGPTHQPIEQLIGLRSIPNFTVIRPCDSHETAAAWALAMTRKNSPTALILSRQNLKLQPNTGVDVKYGAYLLKDAPNADMIIMATGSEVQLALETAEKLEADGISARVVSFPSWELFEEQPQEYKDKILPPHITKRVAVEAASPMGWHKYVGTGGKVICMEGFGASGRYEDLVKAFGFTVENVVKVCKSL